MGVFELLKASGQINAGAKVWCSITDGNVKNAIAPWLWPIGTAVTAAGTSAARVRVRLDGGAVVVASA